MGVSCEGTRLFITQVIHVLFFSLITWKMVLELNKASVEVDVAVFVTGIVFACIGGLLILLSGIISKIVGYVDIYAYIK